MGISLSPVSMGARREQGMTVLACIGNKRSWRKKCLECLAESEPKLTAKGAHRGNNITRVFVIIP